MLVASQRSDSRRGSRSGNGPAEDDVTMERGNFIDAYARMYIFLMNFSIHCCFNFLLARGSTPPTFARIIGLAVSAQRMKQIKKGRNSRTDSVPTLNPTTPLERPNKTHQKDAKRWVAEMDNIPLKTISKPFQVVKHTVLAPGTYEFN